MALEKMGGTGNRKTRRTDYTKGVPSQWVGIDGKVREWVDPETGNVTGYRRAIEAYKAVEAAYADAEEKLSQADILGHAVILLAESEGLIAAD